MSEQPTGGRSGDDPIDLGTIVAREVPGTSHTTPPDADPTGAPAAGRPVPFERRSLSSLFTQIGRGTKSMASEVVEVRRGPIPNSRPVPEWVRGLAWFLDESVPIGGGHRVGADGIVSFVPVVGDAAGLVASTVVVLAGIAAGVSLPTTILMMFNVGLDTVIGAVPFLGAVFDLAYKSNTRNLRLIEADLHDRAGTRRSAIKVFVLSALVISLSAVLFMIAVLGSVYLFYRAVVSVF